MAISITHLRIFLWNVRRFRSFLAQLPGERTTLSGRRTPKASLQSTSKIDINSQHWSDETDLNPESLQKATAEKKWSHAYYAAREGTIEAASKTIVTVLTDSPAANRWEWQTYTHVPRTEPLHHHLVIYLRCSGHH